MSSLAIVEKRPAPFVGGGGGCAGGVLFHLLDWHRRLARKRRLFSPRRLLPSSLRSSPRRLPSPPPTPPPPPAPRLSSAADVAAPGVVARLMGLESWPAGPPPALRPQKQRKVEVSAPPRGEEADVVLVLPPSQRPPTLSPAPRNHHGADLPARSPRRSRLVHAAAIKLLDPGARASSRASARLALAYACSSPQHRMDGHSNALQRLNIPDDFLSRSDSHSLPLERSSRLQPVAVQPPVLPADSEWDRPREVSTSKWDNAITSRRHEKHSIDTMSSSDAAGAASGDAIVVLRSDFDDANVSKASSGMDSIQKDHKVRTDRVRNCARIRSSGAGVRTGEERLLRKRGTHTLQDVAGNIGSRIMVSSNRPAAGSTRELMSGSRRAAHHGPGQRREMIGTITPQRSTRRDVMGSSNPQRSIRRGSIDGTGLASTTTRRITVNTASGPKRGSCKEVGRDTAVSNREVNKPVAFASSSSVSPVTRASSQSKVSEKRGCRRTKVISTSSTRLPVVESSPSVVGSSEKEEFSRLLKAKINELGLSDRIESSDALSGKLTASVLQELISALANDTNTDSQHSNYSDACNSQHSNYSDAADPLSNGRSACNSNDRSPDFQKCYQRDGEVESSATCMNNEPNQPSPTSVLEPCFSNDTSSLGSPTEKIEGKEYFVSIENKMEDLFNLESDIVDLAKSIDKMNTDAEEIFHGIDKMSSVHNLTAHDFKLFEARLYSIGEAISNVELLLGSSPLCTATSNLSLHCFIVEMLEAIMDLFGGSKSLGITEEKKYQQTNFIFDCIIESMNSKFCDFGKCGYKAWLRLPLSLTEDLLKREISKEICNWRETRETTPNRVAEKELDQMTARWDACQVEAFDISIAIENDILETLVDEFAFDQW